MCFAQDLPMMSIYMGFLSNLKETYVALTHQLLAVHYSLRFAG